jgi:hypothetical protein
MVLTNTVNVQHKQPRNTSHTPVKHQTPSAKHQPSNHATPPKKTPAKETPRLLHGGGRVANSNKSSNSINNYYLHTIFSIINSINSSSN